MSSEVSKFIVCKSKNTVAISCCDYLLLCQSSFFHVIKVEKHILTVMISYQETIVFVLIEELEWTQDFYRVWVDGWYRLLLLLLLNTSASVNIIYSYKLTCLLIVRSVSDHLSIGKGLIILESSVIGYLRSGGSASHMLYIYRLLMHCLSNLVSSHVRHLTWMLGSY